MKIRVLSEVLLKKAEQELNEDPNRTADDIHKIRCWLKKQYHLSTRADDQYLLCFLRGCKFSLQRTKAKLDFFYSCRNFMPEFFLNRNPFLPEIQEILTAGTAYVLPHKKNSTDPTTIICRYSVCRYETMSFANLLKILLMIIDILMNEDDNMLISGLRLVCDFKGYDLKYMLQFTPTICKNFLMCVQSAYPIRFKGLHCINAPEIIHTMYSIAQPFMSDKFKNRLRIYSEKKLTDIYKVIDRSILPKEYGGDGDSVTQLIAVWKTKLEQNETWFREDSIFQSNEKLRPVCSSKWDPSTILGIEGSFRALDID